MTPALHTQKRPLRCIIIGAGVSGILAAYKFGRAFKSNELQFQVFEKNADLGGTWYENRYPGCACDVPSHIYQFSFAPNPYWSTFYASSAEIQTYLRAVVSHHDLGQYIRFNCKVNKAVWNKSLQKWIVTVEEEEEQGNHECDVLINAGGILNNPKFPLLDGLQKFKGPIVHTASWKPDIDLKSKKVAIIGAGASAIQVLPPLQSQADHIDVYIRTPSWITPPAGSSIDPERNHVYSNEEICQFRDDPSYSLKARKGMESKFNSMYKAFFRGSEAQSQMKSDLEEHMKSKIHQTELRKQLIPSFDVGCRRINPGDHYLEALQKENVDPVFESIDEVTSDGIVAGGTERCTDVIVAATGFDTSFRPRFPIIGRDNLDLGELWKDNPVAYYGVAVSGFPNYLMFLGPNTPISNGSLMGSLEATGDYFVRLLRKMIDQEVTSFEVRPQVQADFDMHTQSFMQSMVWTGTCRSWFKNSRTGKVTAVWPGSGLHYREVLASDRWEDYEWSYPGNRFAYWRLGFSKTEREEDPDLSAWIKPYQNLPQEAFFEFFTKL